MQVMVSIMHRRGVQGLWHDNWGTKIKTTYQVARYGTVSGAAMGWRAFTPP